MESAGPIRRSCRIRAGRRPGRYLAETCRTKEGSRPSRAPVLVNEELWFGCFAPTGCELMRTSVRIQIKGARARTRQNAGNPGTADGSAVPPPGQDTSVLATGQRLREGSHPRGAAGGTPREGAGLSLRAPVLGKAGRDEGMVASSRTKG